MNNLPLIITDSDGELLYVCRTVKLNSALRLFTHAAAKNKKDGIVYLDGKAFYTKETTAGGKRLRFFMDSDKLCNCFGISENRLGDGLFDIPSTFKNRVPVSLKSLVRLFAMTYSEKLFDEGVRVSAHNIAADITVNVSPNAFALCLAIMVKLCANEASSVKLSFTNECGRISIYADSTGGKPLKSEAKETLSALLYEVAYASGFAIEESVRNQNRSISLSLEPLDISLLGLKTASVEIYKKSMELYIEMFL